MIHPKTQKPCVLPVNGYRYPEETMKDLLAREKIIFGDDETQIIQIKEYLQDYEAKLSSVVTLDSRSGSNELKALFDSEKIFDNPKPTALLREIFGFILDSDDLFLDFFSGSGSSAHAVIDMNRQDGGSRRSVSVQFPEPVDAEHAAYAKGLKTISEIGAERIRRVLRSSVSTDEGLVFTNPKQQGLRLFRLADSHTRRWTGVEDKTAEAYGAQLEAFADSLAPGWKPEAVIWEVALREGFSLTALVQPQPGPKGQRFWRVTDAEQSRAFIICLDDKLTINSVKALSLSKDDLFVCRDSALDNSLAANLALQCRLKVI